jgi:hypothetical protein
VTYKAWPEVQMRADEIVAAWVEWLLAQAAAALASA